MSSTSEFSLCRPFGALGFTLLGFGLFAPISIEHPDDHVKDLPNCFRPGDAYGIRLNPEVELVEVVGLQANTYQRALAGRDGATATFCVITN